MMEYFGLGTLIKTNYFFVKKKKIKCVWQIHIFTVQCDASFLVVAHGV